MTMLHKAYLLKCRDEGHLNKWDIATAIDGAEDFYELKELLVFLIMEGMIKVRRSGDR